MTLIATAEICRFGQIRLESFKYEDHLGVVNELSWWEFMQRTGAKATPDDGGRTKIRRSLDLAVSGSKNSN